MSEDLVVQTNGPYLRVVLPDFDPDWAEVWGAVDFELEEGIERAEVIAPSYPDERSLAVVREVVGHLERCHVETVVEWQGQPPAGAGKASSGPQRGPGQVLTHGGTNDPWMGGLCGRTSGYRAPRDGARQREGVRHG